MPTGCCRDRRGTLIEKLLPERKKERESKRLREKVRERERATKQRSAVQRARDSRVPDRERNNRFPNCVILMELEGGGGGRGKCTRLPVFPIILRTKYQQIHARAQNARVLWAGWCVGLESEETQIGARPTMSSCFLVIFCLGFYRDAEVLFIFYCRSENGERCNWGNAKEKLSTIVLNGFALLIVPAYVWVRASVSLFPREFCFCMCVFTS